MTPLIRIRQFRTSFRSKLFSIFTVSTGIISALFVLVQISGEIRNYQLRSTEKAQLLASLLAGNIRLPLFSENITELNRHAADMISSPQVAHITIKNFDNRTLVDISSSTITSPTSLITSSAPVIATTSSPSAESAISGVPPSIATQLGSVSVSIDTTDMRHPIRMAIFKIGGIALLFWLVVVATCYPILKKITSSFDALTKGLDSMRSGDFSTRIMVATDDEAGRMAQSVNCLASTLAEREVENRKLQEDLFKAMRLEVQQEERRMVMAKLIQTNRMTSLGLLISSLAHNINTPNGAIKLAAQHIARSWKDSLPMLEQVAEEEGDFNLGGFPFSTAKHETRGAIESILNNANRVERVIHDLRTYNLGERNELHPGVSINRVVEEALTIIRAHGRQGEISITPFLSPQLPDIVGNQYQLEQVVVNLLLNAIQAMPDNRGAVTVRTEYAPEAAEVRIVVTDQGEGISPETRQHLFEAFFTTKIERGGSGLGLYISHFIVSEHNGSLTIDSEVGSGTVATVQIPTVHEEIIS